jgi:uncharacterized membrane protein
LSHDEEVPGKGLVLTSLFVPFLMFRLPVILAVVLAVALAVSLETIIGALVRRQGWHLCVGGLWPVATGHGWDQWGPVLS